MILTLKLKLLCLVLCSYAISKNSFAIITRFQYQKTCNVIGGDLKNLTKTSVMEFSVQMIKIEFNLICSTSVQTIESVSILFHLGAQQGNALTKYISYIGRIFCVQRCLSE